MKKPFFLKHYDLILFFPYYHIGGAERVHANIVDCLKSRNILVVFTDRSRDVKHKYDFKKFADFLDLYGLPNKIFIIKIILLSFFSFWINRHSSVLIAGSNSRFFYSLVPRLRQDIKIFDVIHWLDGEVGKMALDNSGRINQRVLITPQSRPLLEKAYAIFTNFQELLKRISVIENRVSVPERIDKDYAGKLNVLYIGRDSYEKRPALAVQVSKLLGKRSNVEILFLGRGLSAFFDEKKKGINAIEGIISDNELASVYKKSHIIFSTSLFEGFPMSFMEAMACGVVPVSTNVGGLSRHLTSKNNSLLINEMDNNNIVRGISEAILSLNYNRVLLRELSINAHRYAFNNFSGREFCKSYNDLVNKLIYER